MTAIAIPQNLGYAQSLAASVPSLMRAVRNYDDATTPTIRIISLGSSVGAGAGLPDPATQAPGAVFTAALNAKLNPLGNMAIEHTNGCVNGSIITDAILGDYEAAKVKAGGLPTLVVLVYGMNEGTPYQYHSGQTYPGVSKALVKLRELVRADGADIVVFTTPHPNTSTYNWAQYPTPLLYPPGGVEIPGPTYAESVVQLPWMGVDIPVAYRHYRVNEAQRDFCTDYRVPCLDAERHGFDALATIGEKFLFDGDETVHPNLLYHQHSYGRASEDFANGLTAPRISTGPGFIPEVVERWKATNDTRTTAALSDDPQLTFHVGSNQLWKIEAPVFYTTPPASDLKIAIAAPAGSEGRISVEGFAHDTSTLDSGPVNCSSFPWSSGAGLLVGGNDGQAACVTFRAMILTGDTPGDIAMQFAQWAAGGTTTIYRFSSLTATRIQ